MASSSQLFVLITIAAALLPSSMAIQHIVGDDSGWTNNFNYSEWAKDKVFYLGDTLVFHYPAGKHNVVKVDGAGFKSCTVPLNPLTFATGNDSIPLKTPGKKWYICGVDDHCAAKMQKLVIQVMDMEAAAPAPYTMPTTTNVAVPRLINWEEVCFLQNCTVFMFLEHVAVHE